MTTFSSSQSQQNQSQQKKQYQPSIGATMVNNTQLNQHHQHSSKGFTIQRPSLGLHQNGSLSTMESSYYTTARQNNHINNSATASTSSSSSVSESGRTCSDIGVTGEPGMTDDEDDYDEDDVEIIMHEGNRSLNSMDSGIDNESAPINSSPAAAAPCQHHPQQPSSDHDHQPLKDHTHHPLQRQLEYYFSRQNLANDTYLVSQMDPDLYVPIATIAKFKRVQDITSDLDFIVSTLRRSLVVTVDESGTKVKPNISLQRTTVILREMPDATEEEINHFLQDLDSPTVKSIKNEYGNMWYITFESEEDALKLLYDTRGKSFKGQSVAARMKSEPVVGSIQARKSALQAESSSSTTHTIANATQHGQYQHSSTGNTNNSMKNSTYNGYYYTYNSPTAFRTQYSSQYSNHHGTSFSQYSSNGGQRAGKFMNSNHNNNNNNNNNRRSTRGGRGRYTTNNGGGSGGIGRNNTQSVISATTTTPSTDASPSTSFAPYSSSDRPWTHRYNNWQTTPKPQRYRQNRSTPPNEQSDNTGSTNDTHDGTSTEVARLSSSLNPSQYPATYKRHSYYQSSNYYRGQNNGRSHQSSITWQQRRYNNSTNSNNNTNLQYHQTPVDSKGFSTFSTRTYSNRPSHHQESSSPDNTTISALLKSSSSTPSHDTKFSSISPSTSSTHRKNSVTPPSSSSESSQTPITTKTSVPPTNGHPLASTIVTTVSGSKSAQEDNKQQNDIKKKGKSKWDKKKKSRKTSTTTSTTTEYKLQEQPDLQSGTYFPPLPGTKDASDNTTSNSQLHFNTKPAITATTTETPRAHEMTVSDLLEERLSAAEIVKKGHYMTLKKPPSMPQLNGSSVSSTTITTNTTVIDHPRKQSMKETSSADTKEKGQRSTTPRNEESFPRLCPVQDSLPASTNFSYADMLKKKENGTK